MCVQRFFYDFFWFMTTKIMAAVAENISKREKKIFKKNQFFFQFNIIFIVFYEIHSCFLLYSTIFLMYIPKVDIVYFN